MLNLVTTTGNAEIRVFVKKPKQQVQSIAMKVSQHGKTCLHERFSVGSNIPVETKRSFSIGSEVEDSTETPIPGRSNEQKTQGTKSKTGA